MSKHWSRRQFLTATGYAAAGLWLAGCGLSGTGGSTGSQPAPSSGSGASGTTPKLDEYLNITTYGGKAEEVFIKMVAEPFSQAFGVKIITTTVASQNEMLAKVKATPGEFDIVRCSDLAIFQGVNEGLLEAIDLSNVPNFQNLDLKYQKTPADPGSEVHTIPFQPGCYVMVKVDDQISGSFDSFAPLYDPKYAGKIALRDYHAYRILQTALYLGYDFNTLTSDQEKRIFDTLREQHKLVKTYWKNEAEVRSLLANRDVWMADYWEDSTLANQRELGLSWWIPAEGTPGWLQGLSIAGKSKRKRTAEVFLNYFLDPKVFMPFAIAAKIVPTLRTDLWDVEEFRKAVPELAPMEQGLRERVRALDMVAWSKKQKEWVEQFEQIKIGG